MLRSTGVRTTLGLAAVCACALIAAGCGVETTTSSTLKLEATNVQGGISGNKPEMGATAGYYANLINTDGNKPAGRLDGGAIITDAIDKPGEEIETALSVIQYSLDGGTIVSQGLTTSGKNYKDLPEGKPELRAITGGTGKYKGASGQIQVTRVDDDSYTHTLSLELPSDD